MIVYIWWSCQPNQYLLVCPLCYGDQWHWSPYTFCLVPFLYVQVSWIVSLFNSSIYIEYYYSTRIDWFVVSWRDLIEIGRENFIKTPAWNTTQLIVFLFFFFLILTIALLIIVWYCSPDLPTIYSGNKLYHLLLFRKLGLYHLSASVLKSSSYFFLHSKNICAFGSLSDYALKNQQLHLFHFVFVVQVGASLFRFIKEG
jgi:hypothetical protein